MCVGKPVRKFPFQTESKISNTFDICCHSCHFAYRGGLTFSTVEAVQYSGGLTSVQWRANISTVEAVQSVDG